MVVDRFLDWCERAPSGQRVAGADCLARAYVDGEVPEAERGDAMEALTALAADPSTAVRRALAAAFGASATAPAALVACLAEDCDSVASPLLAASPHITDDMLIDRYAEGSPSLRRAILTRSGLSVRLKAAIVELAEADEAEILLSSRGRFAKVTLGRLAERFGAHGGVRHALLARADLPLAVRQMLVHALSEALGRSNLVQTSLGAGRSRRLVSEACERATALMAEGAASEDVEALVEHLLITRQLSTAFLLRTICAGQLDLFSHAIARLAGLPERRVRTVLAEGRDTAFHAIAHKAGLPEESLPLFRSAIEVWRGIEAGDEIVAPAAVPARIMSRLAADKTMKPGERLSSAIHFLKGLVRDTARDTQIRTRSSQGAIVAA